MPGDSVCVISRNTIWYTVLLLGIVGCGARFIAANPAYTESELSHIFTVAHVKLVIAEPSILDRTIAVAAKFSLPQNAVFSLDTKTKKDIEPSPRMQNGEKWQLAPKSWSHLLKDARSTWKRLDAREARENTACLLMTSGTTGMPKAAMISHHALITQAEAIDESSEKKYEVKRLIPIPQFHAFALPIVHLTPLRYGHSVWIMRHFSARDFLRNVHEHEISEVALVPPIVYSILDAPSSSGLRQALASLRHVYCAGAPLSCARQAQFTDQLNSTATFSQVWGMTEAGWISAIPYGECDSTGSVGRLLPGFEGRVISRSEHGEFQHIGAGDDGSKTGEIYVRSLTLMSGYLANTSATDETIINGWLRTGDVGFCKAGKWYVIDREKEMIKVRAWQVSPTEIEACILSHPAICDAAVIGVTLNENEGEVPRAYVVLDRDCSVLTAPVSTDDTITEQALCISSTPRPDIPQDSCMGLTAPEEFKWPKGKGDSNSLPLWSMVQAQSGNAVVTALSVTNHDSMPRGVEEEIASLVAAKLAKFKQLAGGVKVVDSIPRNASGKILRKSLRKQAAQELQL